ncbi:MAG: 7-cyano-7-deazaguanine synthase [Nanoarchaeota archaeon]
MKKIVVEWSGGADSTLALLLTHKKYSKATIHPIYVDYGEKYNINELEKANTLIRKWKWIQPLHIVIVNSLSLQRNFPTMPEYIPIRNLVLTSITCQYANAIQATVVVSGSKGQVKINSDPYSFFDSSIPFYTLLQAVVNYAQEEKQKINIICPLAENRRSYMEKTEVYKKLLEFGIQFDETWSCFKGDFYECKKCKNCVEKQKIKQLLQNDPSYKPLFKE